jgi:UDP-N-acetylglucosamine 4,6-dehydratase/5-epimerase
VTKQTVLITGGTGSFGHKFVEKALESDKYDRIIVFSRDEMKQFYMAERFNADPRLRFFIGDIRDQQRIERALQDVDVVIHAAATKIVPTAEYNPSECIKTNILGAMNLIEALHNSSVSKVVALSTDKASAPINLYGATKLASDKLFISANLYNSKKHKISVVRYGNVMGSRGSVIPFFKRQLENGQPFTITDERMTRFMISLDEAVEMVEVALEDMEGGELYVRKIPSMNIVDILRTIEPEASYKVIGIRPGEKLHEQMISVEESRFTYEYERYFKVLPDLNNWSIDPKFVKGGQKVGKEFSYTSDNNSEWMLREDLSIWFKKNIGRLIY